MYSPTSRSLSFGMRINGSVLAQLRALSDFVIRPVQILRSYDRAFLSPDLIAGLTVSLIGIPQTIAFALMAGLPPQMGIYAAIVGSIVGALWGSSNHLQTGPTNAASLLVLSILIGVARPGTPDYLAAAGLLTLMIGILRLAMGLARLGILVNFVSDSVVVGFTSGAGVLIIVNQLHPLLRLDIASSPGLADTLSATVLHLPATHWLSLLLGMVAMVMIVLLRRWKRILPGPLIALALTAAAVGALQLDSYGVVSVGQLPRGLPPLARLPILDLRLIGELSTGALAGAVIGLVEAISIARGIASQTGQRLDSNQEFVGQGLANIASALFSGYTCSGSFVRSAANHQAGARTPLASVFAGLFTLAALLSLAPLMAYIPMSALAGVLILTGYGLIDRKEMARVWRGGGGDRIIMVVTLLATLLLPLQFAVLTGILMSLAHYLLQTSTPRVRAVLPNDTFTHFTYYPDKSSCPQLGIVEILGDLYFGATHHVEEKILENLHRNPGQRFLLLRLHSVERCDISGIHMLENIVRIYRARGGAVYLTRVHRPVLDVMRATGFYDNIGAEHFRSEDDVVSYLFYRVLDPAVCIYECPVRAFKECQNLPKSIQPGAVHLPLEPSAQEISQISPQALWQALRSDEPPLVIDVREPREFRTGHVPGVLLLPLPSLLSATAQIPRDRELVLACRSGRRSTRAAAWLSSQGFATVKVLQDGLLAWEAAGLLEAIEEVPLQTARRLTP